MLWNSKKSEIFGLSNTSCSGMRRLEIFAVANLRFSNIKKLLGLKSYVIHYNFKNIHDLILNF